MQIQKTTTTEITTCCFRVALQTDAVRRWRFIPAHWRQFMYIVGCDSVFVFIMHSSCKFIRYMLYSAAKICQILGHSDAKSVLMEDCDQNFLVMHRENLNVVEADTRKPAVSSIPWSPVTYLSSTSRNMMKYYGKRQKGEAASTNMIMTMSHIVRGPHQWFTRRGGSCVAKKQAVKSGTASQQSGGEGCLQTAPSSAPTNPNPGLLMSVCLR